MIYITGDTHGCFEQRFSKKYIHRKLGVRLTENDTIIIVGDFGGIFFDEEQMKEIKNQNILKQYKQELFALRWLDRYVKATVLFVDGNHENFPRLYNLPIEEKFGNYVGKVTDHIFWLRRGNKYTIEDKTFFVMGGALSHDKLDRELTKAKLGIDTWWKEEIPSESEFDHAIDTIKKCNGKFDYILSHTCHEDTIKNCFNKIGMRYYSFGGDSVCRVRRFFDTIKSDLSFKRWYFGHFHMNVRVDKYSCLYEDIERLSDE